MNDRFLEDLKNRVDIRDVVSKYTSLKKSGKSYMGKSPFRNERTPSFSVSPDKNLWYDFGASEGGDVISFIEKIENFSFAEAVEFLAQSVGIDVPKDFGTDPQKKEVKKDLFSLHKKSQEFFAKSLQNSKTALKYLKNRGISEKTIIEWKLGYGGDEPDGLTKFLLQSGFTQSQIQESGVAFTRDATKGTMKDRFFGRVLVSICEPKNGDIIAFSGRILDSEAKAAKYINSPENPVYQKSSTLFGLDKARHAIRDQDSVILVEGNFDVISAHQAGFTNVVATCGTSLTEDHLRILKRQTKNIYLAFDTDLAGKKATLRSTEMILKMALNPFIIEITDAKDIDEALQKNPDEVKDSVENAPTALDFFFEKFAAKNLGKGVQGEKQFLDSFFYFLKLVDRPIEIDDYLDRIAKKLNRAKSIIEQEYKKFSAKKTNYQKPKFVEDKKIGFTREEMAVGFFELFWDQISQEKKEALFAVLLEENPRNFLDHRIKGVELSAEDELKLKSWEMYQESLYADDFSAQNIEHEIEKFLRFLSKEKEKHERLEKARGIKI